MDTVLGLAITPSTIGWVMADVGGSGCPTVIGDEVGVDAGDAGTDAVDLAAQASAVADRVRTMVAARGERLHGVAVTWSDEAAVGAALLLEALADAGFDHVVPVRYRQAALSLAAGIGTPGARAAVCIVEADVATVIQADQPDSAEPLVSATQISDVDAVTGWLGDTVATGEARPDVLVVAGSVRGMDRLGRRVESALSIPVFVQGGALQALARGAAQVLAPDAELTSALVQAPAAAEIGELGGRRGRSRSYAGAVLMLALGAVTLVASVAAALSLQFGPSREEVEPDAPPQHATVARVAVPAAPPSPAAPVLPPPPAEPAPPIEAPGEEPAGLDSVWDAPLAVPELP